MSDDPLSLIDGPIFPSELGTTLVELAEQIYTTGISSGPVVLPPRFQEVGVHYPPAERKLNEFAKAVNKVTAPDTISTFSSSTDEVRLTSAVNTMIKQANGHGQHHQTIGSVGVGNLSFAPDGVNPILVGHVGVTMSPASPAFSGTIAITGPNAAAFQLTNGGVLPCDLQAKSTTGSGSYSIQLVATQSGIRNSPKSSGPLAITGTPAQIVFSLSLDNTTWTPNGVTPVVVGNVIDVMSPTLPAATATITLGGADAASFQLTNGGALPCQVEAKAATVTGTYHVTLIATQAGIVNSPFTTPAILIGGNAQAFASLGLSSQAWSVTGSVVTVGNVLATLSPASPASTAAITLGGTHASSFQLTNSGNLPCALQAKAATAVGTYSITLTATQTGITGSPFTTFPALTITGAAPSAIMPRTFTNTSSGALPAVAFWSIRHPFADGEVPAGSIVTATFGGVSVPVHGSGITTYDSGALKGVDLLIDLSGITLAAGASANLVLTAGSGSWSATTSRADADWAALVDTIEISSVTRTSGTALPLTYTAVFDAGITNRIVQTTTGPLGIKVLVFSTLIGGLQAVGEYWVAEKADTSLGPIRSRFYIENTQADLALPCRYDFNVVWKRNGIAQRSRSGVQLILGAVCNLNRPDGQGDWTGTDPALVVTQDYNLLRATRQIPPFKTGLVYTQVAEWACTISTSTGVVTATGAVSNIMGANSTAFPTAVDFRGATLPSGSGFADGNVYWAKTIDADTFAIYDTLPHAITGGATGKLIPSGAGTSVFVRNCCGPMARASLCVDLTATGSRPDIGLLTEWGCAYIVGNTQAFQRRGRVTAYGMNAMGLAWRNSATGFVPGLLPTAQLPAGLGTGLENAFALSGTCSTEIGAGSGTFSGGAGQFSQSFAAETSHMPSPIFTVWLLEGGDYLREMLYFGANAAILQKAFIPNRNLQVNFTGTTYDGVLITERGINLRTGAWALRAVANAAAAAPDGSDEQAYYIRVLKNNFDWYAADSAFKSTNYQSMGLYVYDAYDMPTNRNFAVQSNFMSWYLGAAIGYTSLLLGDNSDLSTNLGLLLSKYNATWLAGLYNVACPYFATGYEWGPLYTETDYIGSFNDVGNIGGSDTSYAYATGAGGTITWSDVDPMVTLMNGDYFYAYDFFTQSTQSAVTPPANLVQGRRYFVRDVNMTNRTFAIAATLGGLAITYVSAVSGSGGSWHFNGVCPAPGGSPGALNVSGHVGVSSGSTDEDGFTATAMATMALSSMAGGGATCDSAYLAAIARLSGANFNAELSWAMQNTP